MPPRGLAAGLAGRAVRKTDARVVSAPTYLHDAPDAPTAYDGNGVLAPQPGPQTSFLSSAVDICVFGGGAGSGKTRGLMMEPARHQHVPGFTSVIFRRTFTEIMAPDGLWDESKKVYGPLGWTPRLGDVEWRTPADGRVVFSHAQNERDVESWKSSQIALLMFDQLETFTEYQFWYLLSRNRSTSGVKPYIRATFNCEPGWLANLVRWWWNQNTGYPIESRSGVARWLARVNGEVHWADTRDELIAQFGPQVQPLSFTVIFGKLEDNRILEQIDPGYRAKLMALPLVEQERLLKLNFKITASAGRVLPRAKFNVIRAMPTDLVRVVRGWDNAATKGAGDYTSAVKIGQRANGRYVILHRWRDQLETGERDEAMKNLAHADGPSVEIAIAQEPGSAGKDVVFYTTRHMAGFIVTAYRDTGDKVTRARPLASQLVVGNVDVFEWDPQDVDAYLGQLDAFPSKGVPDDDVDATTKGFLHLSTGPHWADEDDAEELSLV